LEPVFDAGFFAAADFTGGDFDVVPAALAVVDFAAVVDFTAVVVDFAAVVDFAVVDFAVVDFAAVVDFTDGGLADVDLAIVDVVDFFAPVALAPVDLVEVAVVVDCGTASAAKAANKATGTEITIARKDPV
jgi:hypothetical protein